MSHPGSGAKDKTYNLITVLQQSLQNVWQLDQYIADADGDGDAELADWLRAIKNNNEKAVEQGKKLLGRRLGR